MTNIGEPNDRSIWDQALLYINIIIEEEIFFLEVFFFRKKNQINQSNHEFPFEMLLSRVNQLPKFPKQPVPSSTQDF